MGKPKTILIADDHPLMTEGIAAMIQKFTDYEVAGTVYNGKMLLHKLNSFQPDLVLLDINMPEMNGLQAAEKIKTKFPEIKIVFISMYWERAVQEVLKKINAEGFIPKLADGSVFIETLKRIMGGEKIFLKSDSPVEGDKPPKDNFQLKSKLSERELEIMRLVKKGLTTKEISKQLNLSVYTIDTHRKNMCRKFELSSPNALVKFAHQNDF